MVTTPMDKNARIRLSMAAALTAAGLIASPLSLADGFDLTDKLAVTGFVDMSLVVTDPDGADTSSTAGLDQFEIDFVYDFGDSLGAQVDLEYQDNGTGEEVDIEQAFITYGVNDGFTIKAGRFLSYSGWETEEPTGLFQYSGTGYAKYFYGGYQQGVSALFKSSSVDFGVSVVNDLGDLEGEGRDTETPALELMAALHPNDSWTLKGFYMTDKLDGTNETTDLINVWSSFSTGGLTLAAEVSASENAPAAVGIAGVGAEADGFLLMANYGWDKWGLTFRYHESEVTTGAGAVVEELSGVTVAPSYAFSDNLLIVFEYRVDDDDVTGAGANTIAVEALLTF